MLKDVFFGCFLLLSISVFGIEVSRSIDKTSISKGGVVNITLTINKGVEDGIGKLVEDIPSGFEVSNIQGSGGKVIPNKDGKLKIVWLSLPVGNAFTVKYKLTHVKKSTGKFYLGGTFLYLKGDDKQEYSLHVSSLSVGGEAKGYDDANTIVTHAVQSSNSTTDDSAIYSVQLGAYGTFKTESQFKGLPDIYYRKTRGLFKYFSGRTSKAKAEKTLQLAIEKGYKNAFIVKR